MRQDEQKPEPRDFGDGAKTGEKFIHGASFIII
jgi:hypothetical protein